VILSPDLESFNWPEIVMTLFCECSDPNAVSRITSINVRKRLFAFNFMTLGFNVLLTEVYYEDTPEGKYPMKFCDFSLPKKNEKFTG
jgi:hypothetical protein